MKVISLVPSWTETLVSADIEVVGRTRFCIHPDNVVNSIPIIGGTKDWNWDDIKALRPDLIILDQEENPKFMSEQSEIPFVATHVTSVESVAGELKKIETFISNAQLQQLSHEWSLVRPYQGEIPGILEWGQKPTCKIQEIYYVIWKNPWMVISQHTFVGSMLAYCGVNVSKHLEKYPRIDIAQLPNKESTLLLFSSEPYPFMQKREGLSELGHPYAFIDGEKFSWFGLRSLRFLQSLK